MSLIKKFRKFGKVPPIFTHATKVNSIGSERQFSHEMGASPFGNVYSQLSFIIVSHIAYTGHGDELELFLKPRSSKLMFIGHPFYYAEQKESTATMYKEGILKAEARVPQIKGPEVFLYFKDFLATFYLIFKLKSKFHVYVGIDPLNALVGLLLKRIGFAKIVIFYVIDYVPTRFQSSILNSVYHSIDKVCVYHVDYTWNLSSAMAGARESQGIRKSETNQMTVPTGTRSEKNRHVSFEQVNRTDIAFLSHLRQGQGIELILDALPQVIKEIPSVKLIVIGTGPLEEYFKEEAKKRNIDKNLFFLGYIKNHYEIETIVSKCAVGLAPYVPDPNSFTWYADPGKPKVYLGCGVPVIITKVPEVAFEIEKRGAGIAINYDKQELIGAIVKILTNDEVYRQCRQKALEFAGEYAWEKIFDEAFRRVLVKYDKQ
jgi:glycosyltransferase involved in cell wall biosynthesis